MLMHKAPPKRGFEDDITGYCSGYCGAQNAAKIENQPVYQKRFNVRDLQRNRWRHVDKHKW